MASSGTSGAKGFDPVLPMILVGVLGILVGLSYLSAVSVAENEWYSKRWSNSSVETGHGPALLFRIPFVLSVNTFNDGAHTTGWISDKFLTVGKDVVTLDVQVRWRIQNIDRFSRTMNRIERVSRIIGANLTQGLREWVGSRSPIVYTQAEAYLTSKLRSYEEEFGIEVLAVRVRPAGKKDRAA